MENESEVVPYFINYTSSLNTTERSGFTFGLLIAIPSAVQLLLCGIVLLVFYRVPSLGTVSNLPVVNLVASDFLRAILGFLVIPAIVASSTMISSSAENQLCVAVQYISNVQFAWSSWAIAIVAYSRYDVVVNVVGTPKFGKRQFWIVVVTSWLTSLLTALPPLVGWGSFGFTRQAHSYLCNKGTEGKGLLHAVYTPFFCVVNYLVPSVLVILCFYRVFREAKRVVRARSSQKGKPTNVVSLSAVVPSPYLQTRQQHRRRTAAIKTREIVRSKAYCYIVAIVMSNLLLMLPFACVMCYGTVRSQMGIDLRIPTVVHQITAALFTLNFNVNAFLYVLWIKTLQQPLIALCHCAQGQTNEAQGNGENYIV